MKIEEEVQSAFRDPFHKAMVNILFTAGVLRTQINRRLKQWGLTHEQYNVLRILRGAKEKPLCAKDINCRMVDRSSNTTRIIDRLVSKGYVTRAQNSEDRRELEIAITQKGLILLSTIDAALASSPFWVEDMSAASAERLSELLDEFRNAPERACREKKKQKV